MEYLLKSSSILILFFSVYKLFLEKETFFNFNRWFLLIGILASFLCPLISIPIYKNSNPITTITINTLTDLIALTNNKTVTESFNWIRFIRLIYIAGIILLSVKFFLNLISLFVFISKHKKEKFDGYNLIETQKNINPFSFSNYIIYNASKYKQSEIEQIIIHEKTHVSQHHTIDVLLTQLACIIYWFNPIIWLYKKEIIQNLEFIADMETVQKSKLIKEYQHLLIKTCFVTKQLESTNNFNNSFIKKRIVMINKKKSVLKKRWKYLLISPILLGIILLMSIQIIAQEKTQEVYVKLSDTITSKIIISKTITKNSSENELKKMKKEFKKHGADFNYKNIKYNNRNEITSIIVNLKYKNGSGSSSWNNNIESINTGIHQDGMFISEDLKK